MSEKKDIKALVSSLRWSQSRTTAYSALPWFVWVDAGYVKIDGAPDGPNICNCGRESWGEEIINNANHITAAVNALPHLLAHLDALEKKVARYEERIRVSSSAMSSTADFIRSSAYRAVAVVLDEFAKNNRAALEEKGE